ncbi:MAG: YdcH family protein [Pseudomonadota bacterium]
MESLRHRHAALEAQIEEEFKRPAPDTESVSLWKREKLRIKDELASLERT